MFKYLLLIILFIICLMGNFAEAKDFWQPVQSPPGGTVYCLARDSSGNLYAGTGNSEIFYSTNNGDSWECIFTSGYVISIQVHPNGTVYFLSQNYGLCKFSDDKKSWDSVTSYKNSRFSSPVFCISPNGRIFIGNSTNQSLDFSDDSGETWQKSLFESSNKKYVNSIAVLNSDTLIASTNVEFIWRSIDGGENWTRVDTSSKENINDFAYAINGTIWACSRDKIYISKDLGNTWQIVFDGYLYFSGFSSVFCSIDGTVYIGSYIPLLSSNEKYPEMQGLTRTTDEGQTWTPVFDSVSNKSVNDIICTENGEILAATRNEGVYKQNLNNDTWEQLDIKTYDPITYVAVYNNKLFAIVDNALIYYSTDKGNTWIRIFTNKVDDSYLLSIHETPEGAFYLETMEHPAISLKFLYISSDGGKTWEYNNGYEKYDSGISRVFLFKNHFYISGYNRLCKTSDNGKTWLTVDDNSNLKYCEFITEINDTLYADFYNGIYISGNYGDTWEKIFNESSSYIGADKNNNLYVLNNQLNISNTSNLFRKDVIKRNVRIFEKYCELSLASKYYDAVFISYRDLGLFCSMDKGENIFPLQSGIGKSFIESFAPFNDTTLFVLTFSNSLFVGNPTEIPSKFKHIEMFPDTTINAIWNDSVTCYIVVKDSSGNRMNNEIVEVKPPFGKQTLVLTDNNGEAHFQFVVPLEIGNGLYPFSFQIFDESNNLAAIASNSINVQYTDTLQLTITPDTIPVFYKIGQTENTDFYASVTGKFNNPKDSVKISVYNEVVDYTETFLTLPTGLANLEVVKMSHVNTGIYTIKFYAEKDKHAISDTVIRYYEVRNGTSADYQPESNSTLSVYPNPASSEIYYKVTSELVMGSYISIFDALGRQFEKQFANSEGFINISKLSKGINFIIFENNGKKIVKPFIKD